MTGCNQSASEGGPEFATDMNQTQCVWVQSHHLYCGFCSPLLSGRDEDHVYLPFPQFIHNFRGQPPLTLQVSPTQHLHDLHAVVSIPLLSLKGETSGNAESHPDNACWITYCLTTSHSMSEWIAVPLRLSLATLVDLKELYWCHSSLLSPPQTFALALASATSTDFISGWGELRHMVQKSPESQYQQDQRAGSGLPEGQGAPVPVIIQWEEVERVNSG